VLTPALRARLTAVTGAEVEVFDQYGMTEFGPLAAECTAHAGLHLLTHGLWFEVLDAEGREVAGGEGDLTVTSLRNRAMALLRYRTGDRVAVESGPCACGRTGPRIRVLRRADDLTKIRGVLCSKNDLVDAVRSVPGVSQFKVTIYRDDKEVDRLAVAVSPVPGAMEAASALGARVREALRSRIRFGPDSVEVLPEVEVPRTVSGKPRPVVDERYGDDERPACAARASG
jgi:phenylacetate-CoA ligase